MVGEQALTQVKESNALSAENSDEQTLDSFMKWWAIRTPEAPAFSDAPNRDDFALGDPKQLSFSDVQRISGNLAEQFIDHGLKAGDVIAIQMPNTVELPVVILAALRAGLIPCPFPIHWRNHELDKALQMVPARAMVTIGELDGYPHSQMMCDLAFDHMSIRFVYGIGPSQADGITSLDGYFTEDSDNTNTNTDITTQIDQPALITWSTQAGIGMRPIYRTHRELIAAGLMHVLELKLTTSDILLNPYPLTGLVGLSAMLIPSLLVGASIIQHHPFNYDAFIKQVATEQATYTIAPAAVLKALVENQIFQHQGKTLQRFGCVWSAPLIRQRKARLTTPPPLPVFDLHNLHETAVYISEREDNSEQGQIKLGEKRSNGPDGEELRLLETRFRGRLSTNSGDSKYQGTLYVRGVSVPKGSGIPAKIKNEQNTHEGWTNTGMQCSIATDSNKMDRVISDPDEGIIYHGGVPLYRDELNSLYNRFLGFEDAAVVTIPDPVLGQRLWVVAKVVEILKPTLFDLNDFLKEIGVDPCKMPEHLLVLDRIPRDKQGNVVRKEILNNIRNR